MSYSKNGFLATGTGGGSSGASASVVNATASAITAPYGGGGWILGGTASNPDSTTLQLTTATNGIHGWAWYPYTVNLDGLYLTFDATFGFDGIGVYLSDPAQDTTATDPYTSNHGWAFTLETYNLAASPAPDAGTTGAYAGMYWNGGTNASLPSTVQSHISDSQMNIGGSGSTYGPARFEIFVRGTSLAGVYHYQVFKNGRAYLDAFMPGVLGGKALLAVAGYTGGGNSICKMQRFAGYQNLYETQPVATAGVYASPSLTRPQGTQARQYTFDSDTNGFTADTGTLTTMYQRLQITSPGNANSSVLEPVASSNIADGELWADIYPISADSSGLYDFGLIFRATDANNHYMMAIHQGTSSTAPEFQLYKKVSGSYVSLTATPTNSSSIITPFVLPVATQSRVMVRFAGPSISLYYNEAFVLAYYDSTYTTGRIGVRAAGATGGNVIQFDNLTVTALPSSWNPLPYTPQSAAAAPQYQVPTNSQINYAEVTASGTGTLTGQTFAKIPFDTVTVDPNSLFSTSNNWYTVPVTGTYQITMQFRADTGTNINVGFGVHASNTDGPWTVWRQDYAGTGNRHTYNYQRVAKFNAGDQLRAYAYFDQAGSFSFGGGNMVIEQIATAATVAVQPQQAWQTITAFSNGWVAFGSTFAPPSYYLNSDGQVYLRGLLKSGTTTNDTIMATLPAGYRPEYRMVFTAMGATAGSPGQGALRVDVGSDGAIRIQSTDVATANGGYLSLDGISFRQFG